MTNIVSLVKTETSLESIEASISKALALIDFEPNREIKSVAIKPNLCYYWNAATGYTTNPILVSAVIDYVRERCGSGVNIKIVEADASAMRTKYAFPALGYEKLAREKKVELVNLSSDVLLEKKVSVNGHEFSFQVPQLLLEADLFVNIPKLKIMRVTKITCGMKNIFGCIGYPRKFVYHKNLNEAVVGINKILHPHLTVVDGLVALGRFPIKLNLIMAGVDTFAIDWIASQIMGYRPSSVEFLKIAIKEKLGDPHGVVTRGERPEDYAKIFPKPKFTSSNYWWNFQFFLLKAYKKLSGDIIPPVIEEA